MTTPEGKKVIESGWIASGITNALQKGESGLTPLDPFADIDPLVSQPSVDQDDHQLAAIDKDHLIQNHSSDDESESDESEWEYDDGNVFDLIAEEL